MEPTTKGYALIACVKFAESHLSPASRERFFEKLSPEARALVGGLRPNEWYPRARLIELFGAIASEYGESSEAHAALVRLGAGMAREMTNVFMRLVIRILTPALFAKKLPQLFALDNRGGGRVEVDASRLGDQYLALTFKEMRGADYFAPICEGWIRFFMESMGKRDISVNADPWLLDSPGADEFRLDVRWS